MTFLAVAGGMLWTDRDPNLAKVGAICLLVCLLWGLLVVSWPVGGRK